MKENLDIILVVNNYLSICKFKNPNCPKAKIVRMYLNQKLTNLLEKKNKPTKSWLSFIF
jgi:hypothetical protein